jgi:hypothetical protein
VLTHTQILFFFQAGSQVAFSMHIKTRVFQYDYGKAVRKVMLKNIAFFKV